MEMNKMTRKDFQELATIIVRTKKKYPMSHSIISFVDNQLKEACYNTNPRFSDEKWDRFIEKRLQK
jgi:hypothetical protein